MTPERLRAVLQFGVLALLIFTPLPYGSVKPGPVLGIELTAAALGLGTILLVVRDEDARDSVPKFPLAICASVIALGILQTIPLPFSIAQKFNPTTELLHPLIPYLRLDHSPSVSWSVAPAETTDALLRFIAYVLIGLAAAVAFDTESSRQRFALVLVTAASFQAVYGSGEYLTGRQHIFGFAKRYYLDSATGTFINRNHFATTLAIALPFALTLAIPRSARREAGGWRERLVNFSKVPAMMRLLAIFASALLWMGLLLSHSRAGLLAALAGAVTVVFHFRRTRAARWTAAIGGGVLLTLLTLEVAQAPTERFFKVSDDLVAKSGRLTVWHDSRSLFFARPVAGWGLGTFESAFPTVQSADIELHYDHAHNDWIEWTTEGGVLALSAAIALLMLSLRPSTTRNAGNAFASVIGVACRGALVAVALHALWDFSLRIPAVAVAVSAVAGLGRVGRLGTMAGFVGPAFGGRTRTSRSGARAPAKIEVDPSFGL